LHGRARDGIRGWPIWPARLEKIKGLVELDELESNQLFQTLADWNEQLKDVETFIHSSEFGGPQP
jgi:hypothetical protein